MNTWTSVGSIPARVRLKILMFGLLDARKIHIFAARAHSMLDFDAQWILYQHFIPFLCNKKDFIWVLIAQTLVCLMPTRVRLEILMFELARCSKNPCIYCLGSLGARKLLLVYSLLHIHCLQKVSTPLFESPHHKTNTHLILSQFKKHLCEIELRSLCVNV